MGDSFGSDLYTHHGKKTQWLTCQSVHLGVTFSRALRERKSVSKVYSWPRGAQQRLAHVCANGS